MYNKGDPKWARNSGLAEHLNVTTMTIWRWQRDKSLNFPQASIINGNPFTSLDEVDKWMRERKVNGRTARLVGRQSP